MLKLVVEGRQMWMVKAETVIGGTRVMTEVQRWYETVYQSREDLTEYEQHHGGQQLTVTGQPQMVVTS